jgi:hypothetical protein
VLRSGGRRNEIRLAKKLDVRVERIVEELAAIGFAPLNHETVTSADRLAALVNLGTEKNRGAGKPGTRQVYCGAYRFPAGVVRSLLGLEGLDEIASADVVHCIVSCWYQGEIPRKARVIARWGRILGAERIIGCLGCYALDWASY